MWLNILVIILQFISGSIMYSFILAKRANIDLSKIKNGNPGASNLGRVKGWKYGVLALLLDYLKGVFPLAIFVSLGIIQNKLVITMAALSGIFGHAFSPWLRFKGGKALAVTFGAWSVLTKWEAPVILGSIFTIFTLIKSKDTTGSEDAFRVFLGFLFLIPYVVYKSLFREYYILLFYTGNFAVILYKHWKDLKEYFKHT